MSDTKTVTTDVTVTNPVDGSPLHLTLDVQVAMPDCACEPARTPSVGVPYGTIPAKH
jgi:hypothetical protein